MLLQCLWCIFVTMSKWNYHAGESTEFTLVNDYADTTSLRERKFLNHFLSLSRPSSPSDQNKVDCVLYRGDIERSGRVIVRTGYLCSHFPLHLCEGLSVENCLVDLCLCVGVLPYKIWSKCFPYIRADLLFKGESGNLP